MLKLPLNALSCAGAFALCMAVLPAHAGPGDPSATFIAGNAAPGETTSTRCRSNGFLDVLFLVGGNIVSVVESGTVCTVGAARGVGSQSSADAERARARVEAKFAQARQRRDQAAVLDQAFAEMLKEFDQETYDAIAAEVEESANDEDPDKQVSDKVRADLERRLSDLKSRLAESKADLTSAIEARKRELPRRQEDLTQAEVEYRKAVAAARVAALQDVADREQVVEAAEGAIAALEGQVGSQSARLQLQAAKARHMLAQQELQAARQNVEGEGYLNATGVTSAQANVQAARTAIKDLDREIEASQADVDHFSAEVNAVQAELDALGTSFQLSGRAPTTFEALRTRGINVWFDTTFTTAEDRQVGRRQDIDQYRFTTGVQGRFSERWVAGVALGYVAADSDDNTSTGISSETDTFLIAPYGAYQITESALIDLGLSYAYTDIESVRAGAATSDSSSHSYGAVIGLSGQKALNPWVTVNGRIGQSYSYGESDGYTDSLGLIVPTSDSDSVISKLTVGLNVTPVENWRLFASANANFDMIKPDNGEDRADVFGSTGAEYDFGRFQLRGSVGSTFFRNDYSDIAAALRVSTQL